MTLTINLGGITVKLKIWDYRPSTEGDWTAEWCKSDVSFTAEPWLNYRIEADEVFLCCELEELYDKLGMLLHGELDECTQLDMMEPDFSFLLYPARSRRDESVPAGVKSWQECGDICADWIVRFWNDGLTDNYLSLRLDRDDIEQLHAYLAIVTGR